MPALFWIVISSNDARICCAGNIPHIKVAFPDRDTISVIEDEEMDSAT
jgi:hypothetical protein